MRILQLITMATILAVGIRWAIKEGARPPEEEDRQLILGYDEYGEPILSDDDCDVEKTMELWRDLHRRAKNT